MQKPTGSCFLKWSAYVHRKSHKYYIPFCVLMTNSAPAYHDLLLRDTKQRCTSQLIQWQRSNKQQKLIYKTALVKQGTHTVNSRLVNNRLCFYCKLWAVNNSHHSLKLNLVCCCYTPSSKSYKMQELKFSTMDSDAPASKQNSKRGCLWVQFC